MPRILWWMGDFTENAIEGTAESMRVLVRYPPGHHRSRRGGQEPQPFGDQAPLPRPLAELIAWNLRRQGAVVTLEAVPFEAQGQLTLFR